MTTSNEQILDRIILGHEPGRQIFDDLGDSSWGQLFLPSENERTQNDGAGLRIAVFGSYLMGYKVVEYLKRMQRANTGRLSVCGMVTDDPVSPDAKISVRRRIWRLFEERQMMNLESAIVESGLSGGIPVYTGKVKSAYFRSLLKEWNPDVILVCVFGQVLDDFIIEFPKRGIFNFHPSDLLHHLGAGPQPYQDLINRDAKTSRVSIHELTTEVDAGRIVGQSSEINVRMEDGSITDNVLIIDDKMIGPIGIMLCMLVKALVLHKEEGLEGRIHHIDFSKHFSPEYREQLMEPIHHKTHSEELPELSGSIEYSIPS